jgi:S-adenosylmethionine-dependent methyltransferase
MANSRRRRSVSQTVLRALLTAQLAELIPGESRALDVVDLGGGTGGLAATLASKGHRVTVVDPSPDALASLERRAADAGLTNKISGVQGDAADLVRLVGERGTDVVVCHRVLEVVDSPADALAATVRVLRPGGVLSLLVSQRHAVVLTQALAGHIALARRTFADSGRFDHDQIIELVRRAGFTVLASHGIGAIADHVPEALIDAEAYAELRALEAEISQDDAFRALAPHVHIFAQAPRRSEGTQE